MCRMICPRTERTIIEEIFHNASLIIRMSSRESIDVWESRTCRIAGLFSSSAAATTAMAPSKLYTLNAPIAYPPSSAACRSQNTYYQFYYLSKKRCVHHSIVLNPLSSNLLDVEYDERGCSSSKDNLNCLRRHLHICSRFMGNKTIDGGVDKLDYYLITTSY